LRGIQVNEGASNKTKGEKRSKSVFKAGPSKVNFIKEGDPERRNSNEQEGNL
jgi:hypothetical protein